MHTVTVKKDRNKVTGHAKAAPGLVLTPRGGRHADRRTARNRTRSQQHRNALSGW